MSRLPPHDFWIEQGPECPEELQVVEGPLVLDSDRRAQINVLVHGNVSVCPSSRIVQLRRLNKHDVNVLDELKKAEFNRSLHTARMSEVSLEALTLSAREEVASSNKHISTHAESFLKASYKTVGKKERRKTLFPELEKEVAERRSSLGRVKYPDQTTEQYKDVCVEEASNNIGTQLTAKQRSTFLKRIIRPFACIFMA